MEELATKPQTNLACIASLFKALHDNHIAYCHLKGSPQHLLLSFSGVSDIDVLFDRRQKASLEALFNSLGFKKFNAIRPKLLRDVADFIALDEESGHIIHVHTYYALTIGEPYLRGYQLTIPDLILADRVFDEAFGTYCIAPAYELALLYVTEVLKLRHRDHLRMCLKIDVPISDKTKYQCNWLRKRTTPVAIEAAFLTLFGNSPPVADLMTSDLNMSQIRKMAPLIKKQSARYRLYHPTAALILRWQRELATRLRRTVSKVLSWPVSCARVNPRGGLVVAVFIPATSGKAKAIRLLSESFGKKLDVYTVTFPPRTNSAAGTDDKTRPATFSRVRSFISDLQNSLKLKKVQYTRKHGGLVICHRFPENQITCHGKPVIDSSLSGKRPQYAPDIIFRLVNGSKSSLATDESTKNTHGAFATGARLVLIDADRPLSEIISIMKKEIWSLL